MESLTKENFWNDMMERFPEEMKAFCAFVDEYKKRPVNFAEMIQVYRDDTIDFSIPLWEHLFDNVPTAPKFHDLPIGMQLGIFIEFTMTVKCLDFCYVMVEVTPRTIADCRLVIEKWFGWYQWHNHREKLVNSTREAAK